VAVDGEGSCNRRGEACRDWVAGDQDGVKGRHNLDGLRCEVVGIDAAGDGGCHRLRNSGASGFP